MTAMGADEALDRLRKGNERWVEGRTESPHSGAERREALAAKGQEPFAAVLTCSDSRVVPGLIFDAGLGDLFVIRVAGNVWGPNVLASVEYAVEHLHVPVLLVLGHSDCGALGAALSGSKEHGALKGLLRQLAPAVESVAGEKDEEQSVQIDDASVSNVAMVMEVLRRDRDVAEAEAAGALRIVGAFYHLDSGLVQWLD